MPRKTTFESLLNEISLKHKEIESGSFDEKYEATKDIYKMVEKLYDKFVDIEVHAANNEQKPLTEKELGLPVKPMQTKKVTGVRQTADYHFYWKFKHEKYFRKLGMIVERKEVSDFHNTIINHHDRFNREIFRFLQDSSTLLMFIFIEGSRSEALTFVPPIKRYSGQQIKSMIAVKIGAIASFEARGIHVCFLGSRASSANAIKFYIKHFYIKNYYFVLKDILISFPASRAPMKAG